MRGRGFTLVEVLVAAVVAGLLLTVLAGLVVAAGKVFTREEARMALQSGAGGSLSRLADELRRSSSATLTIVDRPTAVSFRMADPDTTNLTQFPAGSAFIIHYLTPDGRWLRKTFSDTSLPTRLPVGQLRTLTADASQAELMCADVTALTVTPAQFPAPLPADTIHVQVQARRAINSTDAVSASYETAIAVRNLP